MNAMTPKNALASMTAFAPKNAFTRNLAAAVLSGLFLTASTFAGDAATSATAGSNPRTGGGTAAATATYDGRVGFARTDTRSGRVNTARGVAVGVDENGLSLSVSTAVAGRVGPAIATNFNLTIDRDGDVAHSTGVSVANGPGPREVTAGGSTGATRNTIGATSFGHAKAPHGTVRVITRSRSR